MVAITEASIGKNQAPIDILPVRHLTAPQTPVSLELSGLLAAYLRLQTK